MSNDSPFFSDFLLDKFKTFSGIPYELLALLCEQKLGAGMTREVFRLATDLDKVIKFECDSGHFQNVLEYQVWDSVKDTKLAKWFAPCHHISHCGRILIQSYAEPIAAINLPAEVPAFFTDLKVGNWGVYNKQPVALDYGKHLMLERGMTGRMRKADWA